MIDSAENFLEPVTICNQLKCERRDGSEMPNTCLESVTDCNQLTTFCRQLEMHGDAYHA